MSQQKVAQETPDHMRAAPVAGIATAAADMAVVDTTAASDSFDQSWFFPLQVELLVHKLWRK